MAVGGFHNFDAIHAHSSHAAKVALKHDEFGWHGKATDSVMGEKHSHLAEVVRRRSSMAMGVISQWQDTKPEDSSPKPATEHSTEPEELRRCSVSMNEDDLQEKALSEKAKENLQKIEWAEAPQNMAGVMIDHIFRTKGKHLDEMEDPRQFAAHYDSAPADVITAIKYINQELLLSDNLDDICYFCKEQENPERIWRADVKALAVFRGTWNTLVKLKRESKCLNAQFRSWCRDTVLPQVTRDTKEEISERQARHHEFWAQLHQVPAKLEMVPSPRVTERLKGSSPPASPNNKALEFKYTRNTASTSSSDWKTRSSRSRCGAGSWDWGKDSPGAREPLSQTAGSTWPWSWSFDDAPDFASDHGLDSKVKKVEPKREYESMPHMMWWKSRNPDPLATNPYVTYGEYPKGKIMLNSPSLPSIAMNLRPSPSRMIRTPVRASPALGEVTGPKSSASTPPRKLGNTDRGIEQSTLQASASLPALGSRTVSRGTATTQMGSRGGSRGSGLGNRIPASMGLSNSSWRSADLFGSRSLSTLASGSLTAWRETSRSAEPHSFPVPWQDNKGSSSPGSKVSGSPSKKYLKAVQARGVVPRPMRFITGHSINFTPGEGSMGDDDLQAVVDMILATRMRVEEVILDGHVGLSERPLLEFAGALATPPASHTLKYLSMRRCVNAGRHMCDMLVKMLTDEECGCMSLRYLDLSGIPIGTRHQASLSQAMNAHPSLNTVMLADVGFGAASSSEIRNILSNPSSQSWI
jgi:hypothetical protein